MVRLKGAVGTFELGLHKKRKRYIVPHPREACTTRLFCKSCSPPKTQVPTLSLTLWVVCDFFRFVPNVCVK